MAKGTKRLIDSVWTFEYNEQPNNKVEIVKYSRTDPEGYEKEKKLPQVSIVEDDNRTAVKVVIRPEYRPFDNFVKETEEGVKVLEVSNPKHIFDYGA